MSEMMMRHPEGEVTYPVLERWQPPIDPYRNIAAEIQAARTLFERVHYDEGATMCGESLSRTAQGLCILAELEVALLTPTLRT